MSKMGRPTKYSEKIADEICRLIANSNRGLSSICKEPGMPDRATVHVWINKHKDFHNKYARAKEDQADFLAEEMLSIADDGTNDTTQNDFGKEIENREWTNRSRLRVDTRKWIASKLKPKRWGDRLDVTTGGEKIQIPILIDWTSKENRADTEAEGGA